MSVQPQGPTCNGRQQGNPTGAPTGPHGDDQVLQSILAVSAEVRLRLKEDPYGDLPEAERQALKFGQACALRLIEGRAGRLSLRSSRKAKGIVACKGEEITDRRYRRLLSILEQTVQALGAESARRKRIRRALTAEGAKGVRSHQLTQPRSRPPARTRARTRARRSGRSKARSSSSSTGSDSGPGGSDSDGSDHGPPSGEERAE